MNSSIREYKTDRGTINVCRNYVGTESTKDMIKRRVVHALQSNTALTQNVDNDIIIDGLREPHYRRA